MLLSLSAWWASSATEILLLRFELGAGAVLYTPGVCGLLRY